MIWGEGWERRAREASPPPRTLTPPLPPPPSSPARRISNTAVAVGVKKQPSVVMITALHDKPCRYPNGDYLNLVSILNKQDYARLHNYPIVVSTKLADPTLHNMWNKIGERGRGGRGGGEGVGWKQLGFFLALSFGHEKPLCRTPPTAAPSSIPLGTILKTFDDHPDADWYMWVDSDTMIIDVSFLLPFQRFKGKDLVIWGNETRLALGDGRRGINSGVMLIRNSDWSKDFFEQVAELGRIAEPGLENVLMEELTSPEYTYDPGLRDQNAISYLLKRDATVNMPHTQLVNRQYCLNCYWRDLLELGTLTSDDTRVHFINHFSGCQMCTQQNKNDDYKECEAEYVKSYEFADAQFTRALARRPPRNVTHHEAVAQCQFCRANPAHELCATAVREFEAYERDGAAAAAAKYGGAGHVSHGGGARAHSG